MTKTYIGIDPGQNGAMCIMWPDNGPTPGQITTLSFKDENPHKIADTLRIAKERGPLLVAIEDVSSRHNQGVKSTFTFGFNVGLLHGFLVSHSIPYVTVRPQEWQSGVWIRQDKVMLPASGSSKKPKPDPKKTSINAARRLFPDVSLFRTPKCTTPHDGIADALLICDYARRKNL